MDFHEGRAVSGKSTNRFGPPLERFDTLSNRKLPAHNFCEDFIRGLLFLIENSAAPTQQAGAA